MMAHVVVLDSINEDVFVCGLCKMVFNSLQIFLDHKKLCCTKLESNIKDYMQPKACAQTACVNISNEQSETDENRANLMNCTICFKKFKRIKCLQTHMKSHDKLSQCLVCGRCFENNSHLKRHIISHKVWPDGLNETTAKSLYADLSSYSCSYCGSVLSNYSQFRAHLNNHLSLKKFKCIQDTCNSFYESIEDLLLHVSVSHKTTKYICHLCRIPFDSLEAIAAHNQTHNDSVQVKEGPKVVQFKCSLCDATFRRSEKLSLHMLTENHKKACIHCNRTFASDKRLRMHLQIHKKSKPYQCDICSCSFHMKKYLSSHMLTHGDAQFICRTCNRTFKRQDILMRHTKTHLARKCFKCPFKIINGCVKEFSRRDKFQEHLLAHKKNMLPSIKPKSSRSRCKDAGIVEICVVVPSETNEK